MNVFNQIGIKITTSFPVKFIKARFSSHKFIGLPLTAILTLIVFNLSLLTDFTEDVVNSKEFIQIDRHIAEWLFSERTPEIAAFLYVFTKLCSIKAVLAVTVVVLVVLMVNKLYYHMQSVLISVIGSGITIYLGKKIFEVARPHELAYYPEYSFSFPSGHATIAVGLYGMLSYFLIRQYKTMRFGAVMTLVLLIFLVLIGFSRLYLGVHYFSDIIAGYLLGSLCALLGITVTEWSHYNKFFKPVKKMTK
jgi:membrane-associated phospholipid phosphatase